MSGENKKCVKIMQFGEGVFLRGFVEALVQRMNQEADFNGEVYAVKPRAGAVPEAFAVQNYSYNLLTRGIASDGSVVEQTELITCLKRVYASSTEWHEIEKLAADEDLKFIFSNTTEAGIEYKADNLDTFPGKLARLLKVRFAAGMPGVTVLPCELIEKNGQTLREYVLRYLGNDPAADYVRNECKFFDTLVDRIVAGFPADADKYDANDKLMVAVEPFAFWAIQAPESLRSELPLPADTAVFTDDLQPYRIRKVRALNASHTCMVPAGLLNGFYEVGELLEDKDFSERIKKTLFDEILPSIPLPEVEKTAFAQSVLQRFANPFAHHKLSAILLNSVSKWAVRILPVILDSAVLPEYLAGSIGELYKLYKQNNAGCDSASVQNKFADENYTLDAFLSDKDFWAMDLHEIKGLPERARKAAGSC